MNWDYSKLNANSLDSIRTGMPSWYKGHENFQSSNYATVSYSDSNVVNYFELNESSMYSNGIYSKTDTSLVVFKLKQKIFEFPSTFNDNFTDLSTYPGLSVEMGIDIDSTGPLPMIDSIQILIRFNRKVDIDGWGTLKTPLGTYETLRHNSRNITSQVLMINTNNTWIEAPQAIINYFQINFPQPDTLHYVSFYTNSGAYGAPLLNYYHRNKDTTAKMTWLNNTLTKSTVNILSIGEFEMYPNPASDHVNLNYKGFSGFISVIDAYGRIIYTSDFENSKTLNLTDYSGVYLIRIYDELGNSLTKTLITR